MTVHQDIFNPTEEHRLLRDAVQQFAREKVEPQAEEQDVIGELNRELWAQMGELGLLGATVPEAEGGAGLDAVASVIIHHELSKHDTGFALAYLAHSVLFLNNFANSANAEQKARFLPKALTGEWIGCMGMTEPSVGTDVLGMSTTAALDGDHYVLNGAKIFITNASEAQLFYIYAKIDGRISAFVMERGMDGLQVSKPIKKLGMRASTMAEITIDRVRVPKENLLGDEGAGITHMMRNLELERLTLAAMSLGIADRCLEVMTRYAGERQAFGAPLNRLGQIQKHVGDAYAKTEAIRALVYTVAREVGPDKRNRLGTDAAKLFASTAAKEVADSAIQVLGGYGYCREYLVERFWRDSKLLEIGGGTVESHQKNITKDLERVFPPA